MHMARWCDGDRTQRSRVGCLTDKAVKSSKRRAAAASLDKGVIGSYPPLENVPHFQYLDSRLQGDGSDEADVNHRMEIAQSAFSSLSHLWTDHRLSRTTKLRLYRVCVCSSLTHCCEAWTLNRTVTRSINGFNSRCLHVMTGEHYRETATAPAYDLVLAVHSGVSGALTPPALHWSCATHARRQDGAMPTHGTSVRLRYVSNGQPVQ